MNKQELEILGRFLNDAYDENYEAEIANFIRRLLRHYM